jgi:hypothetical protein
MTSKTISYKEILRLKELKAYHGSDTLVKEPKMMQPENYDDKNRI